MRLSIPAASGILADTAANGGPSPRQIVAIIAVNASAAGTAEYELWDGRDTTAASSYVCTIAVASKASAGSVFIYSAGYAEGLTLNNAAIYVNVLSGQIKGSIEVL